MKDALEETQELIDKFRERIRAESAERIEHLEERVRELETEIRCLRTCDSCPEPATRHVCRRCCHRD